MEPKSQEPFKGYSTMCRIVGPRYAECWFDNYEVGTDRFAKLREWALTTSKQYARDLIAEKRSGKNLILMGACGTGKDHLAISVLRAALGARMNVKYVRGSVLCTEFRAANVEYNVDVAHDTLNVDLLVISDIEPNRNKLSEFEERALMTLVDYRYAQMMPTVVTSNLKTRVELAAMIGERIVDRLCEGSTIIPMRWPSYRARV